MFRIKDDKSDPPNFWDWLFTGYNARAGILKLFDTWLILHVVVGLACALLTQQRLEEFSHKLLLPLAAVLFGIAFAWIGVAQGLLQTDELRKFTRGNPDGHLNYIYGFLLSCLILVTTLVIWGLVGLGIVDQIIPEKEFPSAYIGIKSVVFFVLSMSIRECWQVMIGAAYLLRARLAVQDHDEKK